MAGPLEPYDFDFNPYSLPADFVRAIGLVTAATGQTENTIEQLIAGLLGVPDFQYGMVVTLHMSMPQRFNVIRSAAEIRLDDLDQLDALDDLLARPDAVTRTPQQSAERRAGSASWARRLRRS